MWCFLAKLCHPWQCHCILVTSTCRLELLTVAPSQRITESVLSSTSCCKIPCCPFWFLLRAMTVLFWHRLAGPWKPHRAVIWFFAWEARSPCTRCATFLKSSDVHWPHTARSHPLCQKPKSVVQNLCLLPVKGVESEGFTYHAFLCWRLLELKGSQSFWSHVQLSHKKMEPLKKEMWDWSDSGFWTKAKQITTISQICDWKADQTLWPVTLSGFESVLFKFV